MAKGGNIVHQYFKRSFEEFMVLVKVNPIQLDGVEITRHRDGTIKIREMEFDEEIIEDLLEDGFEPSNPLEFNLYLSGLAK